MSQQRPRFPDFVPPTKIDYRLDQTPKLHLRRCVLTPLDTEQDISFDKGEITLGAMEDNDVVLRDETVSRYHCKIIQEDNGYVLIDLRSTNGTFINKVRIREGFLRPGCTISVGQHQLRFNAQEEEVSILPSQAEQCGDLVGRNARMREIYAIIEKIAPSSTTVIIDGETGTGKEVVAQSIHKLSTRAKGPIMIFDCGAVPPNLIESELFGHEKGSFTGAVMTRQGLFEMADGGTLFLDELGELPLDLQPKLLRALEQREVRRVGSTRSIKVDVRIIAATNRNLELEVKEGRFRQDLFYRLSVVRLHLPPLRERVDDIALLVSHLLRNHRSNRGPDGKPRVKSITPDALAALEAYSWQGNVRELVNVIERALSFCEGQNIRFEDLPDMVRDKNAKRTGTQSGTDHRRPASVYAGGIASNPALGSQQGFEPAKTRDELLSADMTFKDAKERWVSSFERDYLVQLLKRHDGNISHAAREADIDRKYFRKLMRKYDIDADVGDDTEAPS